MQALEWGIGGAAVGTWLYLGWRMYASRVWRSIQLTIAGLWIIAPLWCAVEMFAVYLVGGADRDTAIIYVTEKSAEFILWAVIWTAYLLRSRRVANTYARYPEPESLATVFD